MNLREKTTAADVGRDARDTSLGILWWLLALVLGPLPPRWRRPLEDEHGIPVSSVILLSSCLWTVGFVFVDLFFFLRWYEGILAGSDIYGNAMLGMNPLVPFIYALTTLHGFLLTAGIFSSTLRFLHYAGSGEDLGDGILAGIDALLLRFGRRAAWSRREASKGPRVNDQLYYARDGESADLRIVSWHEAPWHPGRTVMVSGVAHAVTSVGESHEHGRLRIVSELRRLAETEAYHGPMDYQPPEPPVVHGGPGRIEDDVPLVGPAIDEGPSGPIALSDAPPPLPSLKKRDD
ncbi:MAG: hypothetical protein AAF533_14555 [Acidobacteriota bacterium]